MVVVGAVFGDVRTVAHNLHELLVQVDKLTRVVVNEEFIVEREVGGLAGEVSYTIAPNLFVIRTYDSDGQVEVEVVGFRCVIANPANSTGNFVEKFRKGVDERSSMSFAKVYSWLTERSKTLQFKP